MSELGVNIDHVATIRQLRGTPFPDILMAAQLAEEGGAAGITVHLREDRRHIQDRDVYALRKSIKTKLNLEMAVAPDIIAIACEVHPDEVCLVPEKRHEITTEGGLDVLGEFKSLSRAIPQIKSTGIRVSLFIDPVADQIRAAADLGADLIEIHTGIYSNLEGAARDQALQQVIEAAALGQSLGLGINAGHGLNYDNVKPIAQIEGMGDLNIGHSIVARAVFTGLKSAVQEMLTLIREKT
ncbi:MAG: pyridoxine 5'-phosphate synthase [Candidatus Omnitrophica bacterium]|nr:pyridoxine 5'-phosphate synthase [bacterium]MBV6481016.1 Pyridoxine 5'-phosphate synthase [bacterium]MCC6733382.1 pyridoxine 5'-phosphate synthase [Candidatus Omnitrophota bacterium]MCE7907943.1 pyridoxine 5'-phosphate synthase [Candidatus Omnitrophica bacterium COP1]MCL4735888.1 pyridoxine 5'-phosphate synthase [Candidatus Omnitrophota bacterium]